MFKKTLYQLMVYYSTRYNIYRELRLTDAKERIFNDLLVGYSQAIEMSNENGKISCYQKALEWLIDKDMLKLN
jgi:hypothetical protein